MPNEAVEKHLEGSSKSFSLVACPFPRERSLNTARSDGSFVVQHGLIFSTGVFLEPQLLNILTGMVREIGSHISL